MCRNYEEHICCIKLNRFIRHDQNQGVIQSIVTSFSIDFILSL